jgi:hypothetical protein
VAYIDTEGTFRPERIKAIAERFELDADAVLDNIIVARAQTYEQQFDFLLPLAAKMAEEVGGWGLGGWRGEGEGWGQNICTASCKPRQCCLSHPVTIAVWPLPSSHYAQPTFTLRCQAKRTLHISTPYSLLARTPFPCSPSSC